MEQGEETLWVSQRGAALGRAQVQHWNNLSQGHWDSSPSLLPNKQNLGKYPVQEAVPRHMAGCDPSKAGLQPAASWDPLHSTRAVEEGALWPRLSLVPDLWCFLELLLSPPDALPPNILLLLLWCCTKNWHDKPGVHHPWNVVSPG